jgi:hypothetical protein
VLGVATVALGFALIENIGYVTDAEGQRLSTALLRASMSVPGHVFTGLVLGLGVARTEDRSGFDRFWRLMAGALIPAAVLHGLYDLPVFLSAHAPPYSAQVIELANRFSMSAPTFLESCLTISIVFECIAAACHSRHQPDAVGRRPEISRAQRQPKVVERALVFARDGLESGRTAADRLRSDLFARAERGLRRSPYRPGPEHRTLLSLPRDKLCNRPEARMAPDGGSVFRRRHARRNEQRAA